MDIEVSYNDVKRDFDDLKEAVVLFRKLRVAAYEVELTLDPEGKIDAAEAIDEFLRKIGEIGGLGK